MRLPSAFAWWPGLGRLWRNGDLLGLIVAVGFTCLVNCALLVTFVWPEAIRPTPRWALWSAVVVIWLGSFCRHPAGQGNHGEAGRGDEDRSLRRGRAASGLEQDATDRFPDAQRAYLAGQWDDAERTLMDLLQRNPLDIEARLMLATLLRHRGRTRQATRQLRRLQRFEAAERWSWEIDREWRALRAAPSGGATVAAGPVASPGPDDRDAEVEDLVSIPISGPDGPSPAVAAASTRHMRRAA